jgi:hypothetical protein
MGRMNSNQLSIAGGGGEYSWKKSETKSLDD